MKTIYYKYAALYTFSYMALGSMMPLVGQYLAHIGFTGIQIGTITASGTLTAILAATVWGKVYHHSKRKHFMLLLLCLAAGSIAVLLLEIKWYPFFLCVYSCMYFFQAPIMVFSDAVTIEDDQPFHRIRKWGAVGFALGVFFAGRLTVWISISVIFRFYTACFFVSAIILFALAWSHSNGENMHSTSKDAKGKRGRYIDLFRDKKLMQLILCIFFVGGTNVANNTYFSFLYIEGGGTLAGVGATMLLMVGSETPFMEWTARLSAKFTMEKVILVAIGISVLRFSIYAFGPPYLVLAALFFTQGMVNGVILVEFVRYVSKLAPAGQSGMAIAVYYAVGSNGSGIVCQLVGGRMLDFFGPGGVYGFFALFNLIGFILYLIFGLHKKLEKR